MSEAEGAAAVTAGGEHGVDGRRLFLGSCIALVATSDDRAERIGATA